MLSGVLPKVLGVSLWLCVLAVVCTAASAATPLLQPTSDSVAQAGWSVSIAGDWMAAGSFSSTGAVFLYHSTETSGWTLHTVIGPPSDSKGDYIYFGEHVALSESPLRLAISSNGEDVGWHSHVGVVYTYVYDGSAWVEEQRIEPKHTSGVDYGCNGVALHGSTLIASGSEGDYFFMSTYSSKHSKWNDLEKVSFKHHELIQAALSLSYPYLAVGSPEDLSGVGSVLLFDMSVSDWTDHPTVLSSPSGNASSHFGQSVSVTASGTVVVGETYGGSGGIGQAHLYDLDQSGSSPSWSLRETLEGATFHDEYGSSVCLSSSAQTLAVAFNMTGAVDMYDCGSVGSDSGCEYIRTFRPEHGEYTMDEGLKTIGFGTSLVFDETHDLLLVGSPECSYIETNGSKGATKAGALYLEEVGFNVTSGHAFGMY
ncbi:hypothetical protein KIPB_005995 [Kipferlia bialata]|uniref:Uncharacterized protein n=1 Tax=Kipferlia bialata TaxID=797122 RepID=A0A391NWF0_9EUKA|nr:hypothetical protein KIPB_005995 [Kipferlia bialata]|eukprot:g5995.t1